MTAQFFGTLPKRLSDWLSIEPDGTITAFVGKVELGTGVQTALAQIVADELDVSFASVRIVQGRTGITPDQGFTAGSQTLQTGAPPLRSAAAQAREALLDAAAEKLGVPRAMVRTYDGAIVDTAGRSLSYAVLAAGNRLLDRPFNAHVPRFETRRAVGRSVARVDLPSKVFGTFTFLQDFRVEGMWHARVIRPPAVGAHLISVDTSSIAAIPGARVVRETDFLAVAAPQAWDAMRAARELKVQWEDVGLLPPFDAIYRSLRDGPSTEQVLAGGDPFDTASHARVARAVYEWPFQSHASLGPSAAVADVRADGTKIWAATQSVYALRGSIAALLAVPEESVYVEYVEGAGCYGHNGTDDAAADAALISRAIGHPVRVQWSVEDELGWDPKGPAMLVELAGTVDGDGHIDSWSSDVWTPGHTSRGGPGQPNFIAVQLLGHELPKSHSGGGDRNALHLYDIASQRVVMHWKPDAALRQSALRSLGSAQNTFANESFVDELAHLVRADPLAFRLQHLKDPRARAVLEAVARIAGWQGTLDLRGVAFHRYGNSGAYVAAIAECSIDAHMGIHFDRCFIAHDCGEIVNPDGLRNQIEGNVIHAASRALLEEVTFDERCVTSNSWDRYPILRFPDIPGIEIELIDRPNEPSLGAGEPTTPVIAPAIANAIYALTGQRIRRVPLRMMVADR